MQPHRLVLVAASDLNCRQVLTSVAKDWGLGITLVSTAHAALALLHDEDLTLVFCESDLGDGGFHELLHANSQRQPSLRIVALIHNESEYSDALRLGAFDAIPVSCRRSDLQWMMISALRNLDEGSSPSAKPSPSEAEPRTLYPSEEPPTKNAASGRERLSSTRSPDKERPKKLKAAEDLKAAGD